MKFLGCAAMGYPISNWNSSGSYDLPRSTSPGMFCVPNPGVFPACHACRSSPKVY